MIIKLLKLTHCLNLKLDGKFRETVKAALMVSCVASGIPLRYVIHHENKSNFEVEDWVVLAIMHAFTGNIL